jgi:diaminopimelate decarboxylase
MEDFSYKNGQLHAEEVPLADIAAEFGTPCYVYSAAHLRQSLRSYQQGFQSIDHLVCYSVKANSNLAVLRVLANEGSGFDVVSGGELRRVLKIGGDPTRIVFSGVGKQDWELREAIEAGIAQINVECPAELDMISRVATELGRKASVALRINPDVDPKTHPYIATGLKTSKFGIPMERCLEDYQRATQLPGLEIVGIDCHIGSQLTSTAPFAEAAQLMVDLIDRLGERGITIRNLDLGGGLGIVYDDEQPPDACEYAATLIRAIGERPLRIIVEPGRSIAGNAGVLLTEVLFQKSNAEKNFIVVDAAMNDLARPSMYSAYHHIQEVEPGGGREITADIVGPVCETGDVLARDRRLPTPSPGQLLAIMSAGAYGASMASNYNTRPRAAEVLVDGAEYYVVRRRETVDDLISYENIPAHLGA